MINSPSLSSHFIESTVFELTSLVLKHSELPELTVKKILRVAMHALEVTTHPIEPLSLAQKKIIEQTIVLQYAEIFRAKLHEVTRKALIEEFADPASIDKIPKMLEDLQKDGVFNEFYLKNNEERQRKCLEALEAQSEEMREDIIHSLIEAYLSLPRELYPPLFP